VDGIEDDENEEEDKRRERETMVVRRGLDICPGIASVDLMDMM
jgi:hypothetical protein